MLEKECTTFIVVHLIVFVSLFSVDFGMMFEKGGTLRREAQWRMRLVPSDSNHWGVGV